jgi:hypothetical protein
VKRTGKSRHRFSPSQVAYAENLIAHVQERRGRPFDEADLVRIHTELQSPDEVVRANAVRQLCPCRVSWEVFDQLRKIAQQMQRDPSPRVRASARHVEEDTREVLALETLWQRVQEVEEETGHPVDRPRRREKRRRCRDLPA